MTAPRPVSASEPIGRETDAAAASCPAPGQRGRTLPFVASLMMTAVLAACGGGGSDDGAATDESVSSSTAVDMAADTVVVGGESMAAVDAAVLTAEAVVASQASAAAVSTVSERSAAMGTVSPAAVASVPVSCPGGGSAVLSISGGTASSVLDGELDAGEVYALTFSDCRSATGAAAVNGALSLTVDSLSGSQARLALGLSALSVQLPRGTVALGGNAVWLGSTRTVDTGSGSTSTVATVLTVDQLGVTTTFGTRTGSFELRRVDVTRQGTWVDGALTTSSMNGSYTIASSRPNGSFEATVTTAGTTLYGADCVPTGGTWSVAFPTWSMQMTASGDTVTLGIDQGKDGTVDMTYTTNRSGLSAEAG